MSLTPSSGGPIGCVEWDALVDVDGFLALGRNRYHCTYVIYTDGTYYYAEDGTTGNLDYGGPTNEGGVSGTNASAVIQATINAVEADGAGNIFFKGTADYTLTTGLIVEDAAINLIFGQGVYLDLDEAAGTAIQIDNENISNNVYYKYGPIKIINPQIRLDQAGQTGIQVYRSTAVDIISPSIYQVGVSAGTRPIGIHVLGICLETRILGGKIYSGLFGNPRYGYGIKLENDASGHPNNSIVRDIRALYGWETAIWLVGGGEAKFESSIIQSNDTAFDLDLSASKITKNWIELNTLAIDMDNLGVGSSPTWIELNRFTGNTANISNTGNAPLRLRQNHGLVSEAHGVATMLNGTNSIVVPHGLNAAFTPSTIRVTGQHAEVSQLYVDTVGAVNFTIHKGDAGNVTANRDIYWWAELSTM